MGVIIPKYITRCFECLPASGGKATIDRCESPTVGFPVVYFKAANNRAMQLAIKTDPKVWPGPSNFDLQVSLINIPYDELVKYGGNEAWKQKGFLEKNKFIAQTVYCKGRTDDGNDCVPPFDDSPPCTPPQKFFGLTDSGGSNPATLDGSLFFLTGTLAGVNSAYSDGQIISGQVALLFKTAN
jgi:hypothetical protein